MSGPKHPTKRAIPKKRLKPPTVEHLRKLYDGLFALEGFIKDNITDASTTIDDVLYGNQEAEWQE